MKKRNHVMQAAVASALLVSGGAFAAVSLDASPTVPAKYASEIVATVAAPVTLVNSGGVLSITVKTGYAMNNTEVRYVRMELDNGAKVSTAAVVTVAPTTNAQACTAGAVNGLGTGVVYFSLTAGAGGCDGSAVITLSGDQVITNTSTTSAQYSMYDQPSQAQAGGSNGRIVSKPFASYITFAPSFTASGTVGTNAVAAVEASPSFSKFNPNATSLTAILGTATYGLVAAPGLTAAGNVIALTDLMSVGAGGTKLLVSGDFSAAGLVTATIPNVFTPANVFFATDATCATTALAATSVSSTTATFNVGATAIAAPNNQLCYRVTGNTAVPIQAYSASLNPVAASAAYSVSSIAIAAVGNIVRNGSSVDMRNYIPAAVTGYIQTVRLWNGGAPAIVSVALIDETTGVVGTAVPISGTIPTNGSLRLSQATLEAALGASNFTAGVRPRLRFTAPTTKLEVQSFFNNANGAYTNLSGAE